VPSAPEPSSVLKLKRALAHLKDLNLACVDWLSKHNKLSCRLEPCADAPGYFLVKATSDPVPNEPFSLVIGDIVQNLRGALDHLAYSLAVKNSGLLSEKEARRNQFPIIGDESENGGLGAGPQKWRDNALPQMIQKLSPQAQAVIEGLQPFKTGASFKDHLLWRLNELVNCDKHRFIIVAAAQGAGINWNPSLSRNIALGNGTMYVYAPVMDGETVIAKVPLAPVNPRLEMHMEVSPALEIAFKDGVSKGKNIVKELGEIHNHVVTVVFPPLMALL
jgi:hypothetical protein